MNETKHPNPPTTRLIEGTIETDCVPDGVVEYAAIVPEDGSTDAVRPLLLTLHGGGGSRQQLIEEHRSGVWDRRMSDAVIPPSVIVMISGKSGTYLDFYDGTERWNTFLNEIFVPFCETTFRCGGAQRERLALGTSMGGFGVLRLAFGQPNIWGAVAACEPAIDVALDANDLPMRSFRRANESARAGDQLVSRHIGKFGPGVSCRVDDWDAGFFRANNPVAMAVDHADAIRASGLKICIEVGDQDNLMLHDAAELLHRILWDQRIEHSYYLHHGADHVGRSMEWRIEALCLWLGHMWRDLHLSESEAAIRYGPPTDVEREWMDFVQGLREMPAGPPPDWSGDRMIAIMRHGQEDAVRANYGAQTDGPDFLEGFRWRSGGKD